MKSRASPITLRAVLLAAGLILANSYWLGYSEMIWHNAHLTTIATPVNVLFVILILAWLNTIARRLTPRWALRQTEILTIYAMLATGSAFVGHDFMPRLMGLLPHAFEFASSENDWRALFFRYLPRQFVVSDPAAVHAFYTGNASFFGDGYWRAWVVPILSWSAIILLLMVIFLAVTVLFREQWVSRERLAYPLIQIPFELSTQPSTLFGGNVFWVGFLLAAGLDLWNGVQFFFPILPEIPVKRYDLIRYVNERPWNAIGSTPLRVHPLLIGIAYLLPLDLSFSVVFFYVFRKTQQVMGSAVGVRLAPGYPFLGEQGAGALFALLAVTLWLGRRRFAQMFRRSRRSPPPSGREEAIPPEVALTILLIATGLLLLMSVRAGMSVWGFMLFLITYLSIVLGLTRMRAELGPPIHAIGYVTPQQLLISAFGTRTLGPRNLTMLSMLNWLSGASYASFRTHPMPHQMEAFKLAERARIRNRSMFGALLLAGVIGIVGSLVLYPVLIYKEGVPAAAEQIHAGGRDTYTYLASWLQSPRPPNWIAMLVLVATFFLNLGIFALRSRFVWCPLHPAGYVIGVAPGTTDILWFPLFIAVVIKWALLRVAGFRSYRRAVPFFIGLVAGEALMGSFWSLLSLFTRTTVYSWI